MREGVANLEHKRKRYKRKRRKRVQNIDMRDHRPLISLAEIDTGFVRRIKSISRVCKVICMYKERVETALFTDIVEVNADASQNWSMHILGISKESEHSINERERERG